MDYFQTKLTFAQQSANNWSGLILHLVCEDELGAGDLRLLLLQGPRGEHWNRAQVQQSKNIWSTELNLKTQKRGILEFLNSPNISHLSCLPHLKFYTDLLSGRKIEFLLQYCFRRKDRAKFFMDYFEHSYRIRLSFNVFYIPLNLLGMPGARILSEDSCSEVTLLLILLATDMPINSLELCPYRG